ncbi:unnamed protein product [Owenia fusiformis]|uniref:Beta-1,4-galactosyltransferase n=1 Tax=Owenia fusiformis TaxID=6347 RepID=A0A8S4N9Q5_OWEFU|nr:unnamed protein product [Owenia fusiformis]
MLNFSKNYTTYKSLHMGPSPVVQSTYTTDGRGRWFPLTCRPRQRTVIVIPFRDRDDHLKIFLDHYVPILQRQLLDYTILVVEQQDFTRRFNKGVMFNAGYKTALSMTDEDQVPLCLILHDIDLLLENDRLTYECSQHPTHLSVGIDTMEYRLCYTLLFGGVVAIFGEQFNISNGFSNLFFGWGGEDDDFRGRLGEAGLFPVHHENRTIARYSMLTHDQVEKSEARVYLWLTGPERFHCDGLNSVEYTVDSIHYKEHYVLIKIDMPTDFKTSSMCLDCFSGGLKTKTIQKAVNTSTVNSTVNNTVNSTVNITVPEICKMT